MATLHATDEATPRAVKREIADGLYWYSRPSWSQPVPITVEGDLIRFSPRHHPTRMQDIPSDAVFERREV